MMRPAIDRVSFADMKARLKAAVESSEPEPAMLMPRPGCDVCRDSGAPGFRVEKKRSIADRDRIVDVLVPCVCRRLAVAAPSDDDAVRRAARGGRR